MEALEQFYDVAREEYADGSGEASPEQNAVAELQERARALIPGAQEEHDGLIAGLEDSIAQTANGLGVSGIRFGSGEQGFDWDEHGQVRR